MTDSESSLKFSSSNDLLDKESDQKDTYYSWVVCACGFVARVIIVGVLHGFGAFFIAFIEEFKITKEKSGKVLL